MTCARCEGTGYLDRYRLDVLPRPCPTCTQPAAGEKKAPTPQPLPMEDTV